MVKFCSGLLILVMAITSFAQAQEKTISSGTSKNGVAVYVEKMPSPNFNLSEYLSENIKYPQTAIEKNIQGKVIVKFVVNEDGHISNAEVIRGVSKELDAEALRVVSAMPDWNPGIQDGKKVSVYFTQPISFKLDDDRSDSTKLPPSSR